MRITARTRVFALLGDPVAHSLSPRMHNAAFQAAGVDAAYIVLRVTPESLHQQMLTLVRSGGGGNVTVPFKELAAQPSSVLAPSAGRPACARVEQLGCANVFGGANGEMVTMNTDVDGVLAAVDRLGASADAWCVLGTGGSARAVIGAAAERGARVAVRSRDAARAAAFSDWAQSVGVEPAEQSACKVIINATPLGLAASDPLPLSLAEIPRDAMVLDLVYGADGPTAWVRACAAIGVRAIDGREVLLAQGAESWRLWLPRIEPPIEIMRAALNGQLG